MALQEKLTRGEKVQKILMITRDLSTECIRSCWGKSDQQDLNDEEIVLEWIKVQQTQENSYFSAEEMPEDEVEYISKTENKEAHSDTISMTKELKQCFLTQFFNKK